MDSRTVLVALQGLGMQGVDCLEALRLSFQIACLRCIKSTEVTFSSVDVTQVLPMWIMAGSRSFFKH